MSVSIFPAAPGTLIITRERGAKIATMVPVVGWYHVQGSLCFPISPIAHGGLTRGKAVITPDGLVTDPSYGVVCGDKDEWMTLTATKDYWEKVAPGYDKTLVALGLTPAPTDDNADPGEAAERQSERLAQPARPNGGKAIPDRPARHRAPRVFKTNSWWKTRDPKTQAITMILGGEEVPHDDDATWEKSGIVEFKELKKAGWTVTDIHGQTGTQIRASESIDDLI